LVLDVLLELVGEFFGRLDTGLQHHEGLGLDQFIGVGARHHGGLQHRLVRHQRASTSKGET
jgi:hypothetical protein